MARSFARASSQYLASTASPVSQLPLTAAVFARRTSDVAAGQVHYAFCLGNSTNTTEAIELRLNDIEGIVLLSVAGGTTVSTTNVSTTLNAWEHYVAVCASATSKTVYRNGTPGTTLTTSSAPTGLDRVAFGAYYRNDTPANYWDGGLAHAAIWSVALSAAEVSNLYNSGIGADPRSVRPDALVAYWPLINGDGDQDYQGNTHLTAVNSPTYDQHPPVLMRSRPKYVLLGGAATAPTISSVTLSGTSQIGFTLTASVVTDQDPVDSTAYRWQTASDGSGTGAADISGETSSTLALTYADFGSLLDTAAYVRCGAIATKNALPSDEAFSAWQQVTAPSSAGLVSSPLKSPFLIA